MPPNCTIVYDCQIETIGSTGIHHTKIIEITNLSSDERGYCTTFTYLMQVPTLKDGGESGIVLVCTVLWHLVVIPLPKPVHIHSSSQAFSLVAVRYVRHVTFSAGGIGPEAWDRGFHIDVS